jgi:hypothetical protein
MPITDRAPVFVNENDSTQWQSAAGALTVGYNDSLNHWLVLMLGPPIRYPRFGP